MLNFACFCGIICEFSMEKEGVYFKKVTIIETTRAVANYLD